MRVIILFLFISISCTAEIVKHNDFTLSYNENYEIADWVSYSVTADEVLGTISRVNVFKADTDISTMSATPADYANSGFDRGHLAPAAVFKNSLANMKESFLMSNMTPQYKEFNRGIWSKEESYIRTLALMYKKVYVVTGTIVIGTPQTIGKNKVAVPHLCYSVVFDKDKNFLCALLLPNRPNTTSKNVHNYTVSLPYIQTLTGISSFKELLRD